jgi:hypothetical protein
VLSLYFTDRFHNEEQEIMDSSRHLLFLKLRHGEGRGQKYFRISGASNVFNVTDKTKDKVNASSFFISAYAALLTTSARAAPYYT